MIAAQLALIVQIASGALTEDAEVREWMTRRHVPGVAYALADRENFQIADGLGLAYIDANIEVKANTIFPIGSVTKPFTTFIIQEFVHSGELSWDDELSSILPGVRPDWKGVTLRRLASHTAGVPDNVVQVLLGSSKTREELIQDTLSKRLDFEPGTNSKYSNSGFMLLAAVAEKHFEMNFEGIVRYLRSIFHLDGTAITEIEDLTGLLEPRTQQRPSSGHVHGYEPPDAAQGYQPSGSGWQRVVLKDPTAALGAGGISSSAFELVMIGHRLLQLRKHQKTIDELWEPVPYGSNPGDYGLGWSIDTVNGRKCVSHSGAMPGFSAHLAIYPDDDIIVAVLANTMSANPRELATKLAARYLNKQ